LIEALHYGYDLCTSSAISFSHRPHLDNETSEVPCLFEHTLALCYVFHKNCILIS